MKINWKARMKNPQFWIMIGLAVVAPVSAYFDVAGVDIDSWSKLFDLAKNVMSNPFVIFSIGVSVYNAVIDPLTKGVTDSERALTYTRPKE